MQPAFVQHTLGNWTLQVVRSRLANAIARGKPIQCDYTVYKHEPSVHDKQTMVLGAALCPQVHPALC